MTLLDKIHYLLQLHLHKYKHAYLPSIGTVVDPSSIGERMDDVIKIWACLPTMASVGSLVYDSIDDLIGMLLLVYFLPMLTVCGQSFEVDRMDVL